MKKILLAMSLGGAVLGMSACVDDHYYPRAALGGVAFYEHAPAGFDGYYDDAYGPFYDGYWGEGGFYYSTGEGREYQLDRSNHFRHESADGFHTVHGGMHSGAMRGSGGEHH